MNAYDAKFAREAKENPTDWIIAPAGRGRFKLVHLPPRKESKAKGSHLRLVK